MKCYKPKYLIIQKAEGNFAKLSLFAANKMLNEAVGSPKDIRKKFVELSVKTVKVNFSWWTKKRVV